MWQLCFDFTFALQSLVKSLRESCTHTYHTCCKPTISSFYIRSHLKRAPEGLCTIQAQTQSAKLKPNEFENEVLSLFEYIEDKSWSLT